jgi:LysM repeat protein
MSTYTVAKGETLSGIGKKLGIDWKKITGYKSGDPNLIYPGEVLNIPGDEAVTEKPITPITAGTSALPGLGDEIANRAAGVGVGEEKSAQEKLIEDLTSRLTAFGEGTSLTEEKKRLEEEKGVLGMRERVGSFEEEMATTQTLLDQLEGDITKRTREFLVSEPQRRRVLAAEREPLMEQLGIAERGMAATTGRLARTEQDILTELGLIEKEKTMPLDLFERELNIRSKIQDLTKQAIPNIATSQFNDEGDLTIVTQDPTTGAFDTQTIKGIGQKADKYQSISSATDDQGNLTIIGITRDGKSEVIGTFKGIGKAEKPITPTAVTSLDDLAKLGYARKGAPDGGWNFFKNGQPITAEQIVQESGIPLATLLSGSENPADIEKIQKLKETEVTKLTRASISQLYGILDNDEKSGIIGAFGAGKTNRQKLDDIMDIVKKYQDVGYSDADIIKLMKEE